MGVAGAGADAAGAVEIDFFYTLRKKVTKERATPSLRPLRGAKGQPASGRLRGAPWNSLCAGARRSDNHGESEHEAWALRRPCHPTTAPPQAQPAGGDSRTSQHPNSHTGHRCARPGGAQALRAAQAGPSAAQRSNGPNGCPLPGFPSGCAEERSGQRIRARDCLSATKWSEFERDPAGREHRRFPHTPARACGDAACRVAFSLVTFSWRRKRKLLRRRAHTPASALQPGMRLD